MKDEILAGIEASTENGWCVTHYACVAGVQRICSDGTVETGVVFFTAQDQPSYVTEGLLLTADRINCMSDKDD